MLDLIRLVILIPPVNLTEDYKNPVLLEENPKPLINQLKIFIFVPGLNKTRKQGIEVFR